MPNKLELKGVIPAIILPFHNDYSIDEEGLRRHIRRVMNSGISGIVCNAHALRGNPAEP